MNANQLKYSLLAVLIFIAGIITTCEFSNKPKIHEPIQQDTLFMSQWRREKSDKIKLVEGYEKKIATLNISNDSLQSIVKGSKKSLAVYRFKDEYLQKQMQEAIKPKDKALAPQFTSFEDSLCDYAVEHFKDSIKPILDSLIFYETQTGAACDVTINTLEQMVANRDSAIVNYKYIQGGLKDLQEMEQLKSQYLTEQLNTAFKVQRKKSRQNKLLAGGLLILTGITTSILLTQSLK